MYGLSDKTDLSPFVGLTLQLVSLSEHHIALMFDTSRNVGLSIEGEYATTDVNGSTTRHVRSPSGAAEVAALLGAQVSEAGVSASSTTTLTFDDGSALAIFDSSRTFESYQIFIGSSLIVV